MILYPRLSSRLAALSISLRVQKRRMTCAREERRNRGVRDERAAHRVYLSCLLSRRAALPLLLPLGPSSTAWFSNPSLPSRSSSSSSSRTHPSFFSFSFATLSRDTLSELVRYSSSLSLSFILYFFFTSLFLPSHNVSLRETPRIQILRFSSTR